MNAFLATIDAVTGVARVVFLVSAIVVAVVCGLDWAVRTRRISPFSGVSRFFRASISPLFAPIERRIVRSGGIPSNAPWWALGIVIMGGITVIWLLGFIRSQAATIAFATNSGGRGITRLIVGWLFTILQIALFVRVISSWIRGSAYSWWARWSYTLTEPMLRPLRRVIPLIAGSIDITPIVAYFGLTLLSGLILANL